VNDRAVAPSGIGVNAFSYIKTTTPSTRGADYDLIMLVAMNNIRMRNVRFFWELFFFVVLFSLNSDDLTSQVVYKNFSQNMVLLFEQRDLLFSDFDFRLIRIRRWFVSQCFKETLVMVFLMKSCDESLPKLIEVYDRDNLNTFVSLYFDGRDERFIKQREKVIASILKGDELQNFVRTMETIREYLKKNRRGSHAIFASDKHHFFEALSFAVDLKNSLSVDVSPYIHQIAELADEWQAYTLVLLNSNHAKIFSFSCGELNVEKNLSADIMNKHKKGGMSQARFQRLRKGSIHAFLVEVVEALGKIATENIILAGPGEAKKEFYGLLPVQLQKGVISEVDIAIDDACGLVDETKEIMKEKETEEHHRLLDLIQTEILKGGLAVYGLSETLAAVRNGQVEALLVEPDVKRRGWVCERCQLMGEGAVSKCPSCGKATAEVDIIEEIVKLAERTGAIVEFSSDEDLQKIGPVAGLLRFK
jgi:peptide chain release factor subunit 1